MAGEIGRSVEQKRVVFGEIPLHVVAGFIHPVAEAKDRLIDAIGRWSNIDVFMAALLIALLQFGTLTQVYSGPGLLAFAGVVVVTMFATLVFDARLMWDAAGRNTRVSA